MAKAQKRGNKEVRKSKSAEKAPKAGAKYLAAGDLSGLAKGAGSRPGAKK
jgi:hypothetical protein